MAYRRFLQAALLVDEADRPARGGWEKVCRWLRDLSHAIVQAVIRQAVQAGSFNRYSARLLAVSGLTFCNWLALSGCWPAMESVTAGVEAVWLDGNNNNEKRM